MKRNLLLIIFLILISSHAAAGNDWSFDGYYKSFFVLYDPPGIENRSPFPLPDHDPVGLLNNRLRLNLLYGLNDRVSFHLSYDLSPRLEDRSLSEQSFFMLRLDPLSYRFSDPDSRLYPKGDKKAGSFELFQNLDRAFVTIKMKSADLFIGRQAIAWGSSRVVNPTDVIAPFAYQELDIEDRIGVDAIRLRIPSGFMGEYDIGCIFGKDGKFDNSALYLRRKCYIRKTDLSMLVLGFRENLLLGMDMARSIGNSGFWFEAAYTFVDALDDHRDSGDADYARLSLGLDHSFTSKTYAFFEYHFNGAGSSDPENYLANLSHAAFSEGAVYLMGKHYLTPGVTYQLTPLITLMGQALINVTGQSAFVAPQVEISISENIYLAFGSFFGLGKRPLFDPVHGIMPQLRSEFGSYPDIYFSSLRIYF